MADGAAEKLKAACHAAYRTHPKSCSNAVWDVIRAMAGRELAYQPANALIDTIAARWTKVDMATAGALAARGELVVGGRKDHPNGHVVIVYPGPAKPRGGYTAVDRDGAEYLLRPAGLYPLAMSTSLGSWPGAMSDGDKTVWDPWGSDEAFRSVGFWHCGTGNISAAGDADASVKLTLSDGYVIEIPRDAT